MGSTRDLLIQGMEIPVNTYFQKLCILPSADILSFKWEAHSLVCVHLSQGALQQAGLVEVL